MNINNESNLLQNLQLLYVRKDLNGIERIKSLQSAYRSANSSWSSSFMGIEVNSQTNIPTVAYIPFPNKINELLKEF